MRHFIVEVRANASNWRLENSLPSQFDSVFPKNESKPMPCDVIYLNVGFTHFSEKHVIHIRPICGRSSENEEELQLIIWGEKASFEKRFKLDRDFNSFWELISTLRNVPPEVLLKLKMALDKTI